ncbi:kinetochore scaffold 1 [Engraulis encrasicolus]|uniref:kinetochore scaffold 1 n=1 Tax=Engraulis encrasicolus TaxID=184585 RepID=UPI002FD4FF3D
MESTETLKFDFDRAGPSRRRISSILKAPRMSMKDAGADTDQKENQVQPIEKRSSRRVSFAATKDVLVFCKEMTSSSDDQSPSPSCTSMGPNSGAPNRPVLDGIENLLMAPLQVPGQKQKVQFFSDPVLSAQNEKTVLFGDDSACMDMTQCHTILIDDENSGPNLLLNTEKPLSAARLGEPASTADDLNQRGRLLTEMGDVCSPVSKSTSDFAAFFATLSKKNFDSSSKAVEKESDALPKDPQNAERGAAFGMFLASLSKPSGLSTSQHVDPNSTFQASSSIFMSPLLNSDSFLMTKRSRGVTDKENQPLKLTGFDDDMDFTTSHTAAVNFKGVADAKGPDPKSSNSRKSLTANRSVVFTQEPGDDDMDFTKSHTAALNFKDSVPQNPVHSMRGAPSSLQQQKFFSNVSTATFEADDMEVTKCQTAIIDTKGLDAKSSNTRKSLSANRSVMFTQQPDDEDMDFTKSHTAALNFKDSVPQNLSMQDSQSSVQQQQKFFNNISTAEFVGDDMEVTKCQTAIIDTKGLDARPSSSNTRKSLSTNRSVMFTQQPGDDDMEFTKSHTAAVNFKDSVPQNPVRSMQDSQSSVQQQQKFFSNVSPATFEAVDMEVTKCQTAIIDTKGLDAKSSAARKSLSANRSVMFAQQPGDDDMEFTKCHTAAVNFKDSVPQNPVRSMQHAQSSVQQQQQKFFSNVSPATFEADDMEVTKCQTAIIDTKGLDAKSSTARKSLSANRSVMFTQQPGDDDMEFTKCHTAAVNFKGMDVVRQSVSSVQAAHGSGLHFTNAPFFSDAATIEGQDNVSLNPILSMRGAQSSVPQQQKFFSNVSSVEFDGADMEVTKCQTVTIDTKGLDAKSSTARKSLSANRSVMFTQQPADDDMEFTKCHTAAVNFKGMVDAKGPDPKSSNTRKSLSANRSVMFTQQPADDDMDFTKCHTAAVNFKGMDDAKSSNTRKSLTVNRSVIFSQEPGDDDMDFTKCHTAAVNFEDLDVLTNVRKEQKKNFSESTIPQRESRLPPLLQGAPFSGQQKFFNIQNDLCTVDSAGADDMEETRCQTVVIDTKADDGKPSNTQKSMSANRSVMVTPDEEKDGCDAFGSNMGATQLGIPAGVSMNFQNRQLNGPSVSSSSVAGAQFDLTESNQSVRGSILKNSRISSCVPSSLRHAAFSRDPHPEVEMTTTVAGGEMEMTRCQTVDINTKYKAMTSRDDFPDVHIQTTNSESSVLPMTSNDTSASSQMMGAHASELQRSTNCEDQRFIPYKEINPTPERFFPALGVKDVEPISGSNPVMIDDSEVMRKSMSAVNKESRSQKFFKDGHDLTEQLRQPSSRERCEPLHQEKSLVAPVSARPEMEVCAETCITNSGCEDNVDLGKPHGAFPTDPVSKSDNPASQKTKSRRRSLLDLQATLRRISQAVSNDDPPQIDLHSATAPLPCLEVTENTAADLETITTTAADTAGDGAQKTAEVLSESTAEASRATSSSANHDTKPLNTRVSLGILPKLPSRPKPPAAAATGHETTRTGTYKFSFLEAEELPAASISNLPDDFEDDDRIDAEELPELSSKEDISDEYSVKQNNTGGDVDHSVDGPEEEEEEEEDDVFLSDSATYSQKRPRPPENGQEDDVLLEPKRRQEGFVSDDLRWDANITDEASNVMTKTMDATGSSRNSTYLKSDSTYKHSQCDSQIEQNLDYEFAHYQKMEDGSITVNEFLKYFGIDFVIHRSRPSALPDNFSRKQGAELEHLLREALIHRPKQRVYEADREKLTDLVESLKPRLREQDYPLKHMNEALLKELGHLSTEQLQCFGSKMKGRKAYFRKKSKMTLHAMKADMYSELVQTTQEAKQKLEEKLVETDALLEGLDRCINDLEGELAAVESVLRVDQVHTQIGTLPALKNKQEELNRLETALDERRREMALLQTENKNKAEKLDWLKADIKDIREQTAVLDSLNEWKLSLKEAGRTVFSFLHNTLLLKVAHEPWTGLPNDSEKKLLGVSLQFQLDAGNPDGRTALVHDLLSEVFRSETDWLKKYPTSHNLPLLLHDVSLAVSRKRLLGFEIERLDKYGALRLDVLVISCADRRIQLEFSSLKTFVKFTLTLAVTAAYPLGGLTIHDFQNHIGDTRVEQIQDVLSSTEPGRNYLTKMVKKIHDQLLV